MDREQRFLEELGLVERVVAWVCARRGLRGAEAEDFASTVKVRLIENDYEILGKFQGRSSLKTYLTAVVSRMYLDFQVRRFGKWRPSAAARKLGALAQRLEQLLYRDGLSRDEACGVLLTDTRVSATRDELYELARRLPARPGRRPAGGHEPESVGSAASRVEQGERQALAGRFFCVIRRTLATLPARERLFVRLHFGEGFTVAEAARAQGWDQKALYRKEEDILARLRAALVAEGLGGAAARELLQEVDWEEAFSESLPGDGEDLAPGPSLEGRRTPGGQGRH